VIYCNHLKSEERERNINGVVVRDTTFGGRGKKLLSIKYKNSVSTSQETHYISAPKTSRLTLFKEVFYVDYENHCKQNAVLSVLIM
jgi:hypothetical protein